ncbi:MAG TPA: 3-hydroxyacyl-CoA dehydrogenase family protein [Acidimicrobiales bacterium]|nr:3-hydroxyacyl-CoA dehydrogenase family protein [Acidimicrobiales bacterium]
MTEATEPAGPVLVVGGGRMGAGIAQVCAATGRAVLVVESDSAAAAGARDRVATALQRAAERGALDRPEAEVAARVRVETGLGSVDPSTALAVEAVSEDIELKLQVLAAVSRAVGPDCLVATNTSSLPIGELAAAVEGPERFLGMHFFNPVPASALVEIVVGERTSEGAVARARAWVAELGKQEVVVRDSPGFATSRLGVLLGLEAIRMLEEGVADAASIDRAMELGYRHPMGPLRSTDLVGLDVRLAIAEHLQRTLGERFAPPALLRAKVERGELGRKAGRGFYDWTT